MKHPPHVEYRDSGADWIGSIPSHWDLKRGRFCARLNPPVRRLAELSEQDEVSFVPMESVGEWGGITLESTKTIEDIGSGYSVFQDGDVIAAKITPCFENGKGALARGLTNGIAFGTTELHVLRATPKLDSRFLFYLTISSVFRSLGEAHMYGAGGQKRVPAEFVRDFPFPLPPKLEQCAIAEFLDTRTATIDTLIAKKQALIERLREKRQALISRVVTRGLPPDAARAAGLDPQSKLKPSGIEWIGEVPEHWRAIKLAHGFKVVGSGTTPRSDNGDYYGGDIPWVTTSELREDTITSTAKSVTADAIADYPALRVYPIGTLLIAMYGATIGRLGQLGIPATVNQACCAFAYPLSFDTRFVFYWLAACSSILLSLASGGGQPNLSQEVLRGLRAPAPGVAEQRAIAEYLDRETGEIDRAMTKVESAIKCLQEYRSALITAAVTGKIDVRNIGAGAELAEAVA